MSLTSFIIQCGVYTLGFLTLSIFLNAIHQLLPKKKSEPPVVWHWIPFIGNAVEYGTDPLAFYTNCQRLHGPIFTYLLFGKKMTVYLGSDGNEFILNGRLQDVNAEEIYGPLTTPVFGRNIIYDCPNSKLMEQKKFVKFGLTQRALEQHVSLIENEVLSYISSSASPFQTSTSTSTSNPKQKQKQPTSGTLDITHTMATLTIFTASRALQGPEVRAKLTSEFADLYDDLDRGFRPINFLAPWLPLPQNWRRDTAHARMTGVYMDIISRRRSLRKSDGDEDRVLGKGMEAEEDMIDNLMGCVYKSGERLPDMEIAHLMITLLMAGQHSSSSSSAWIMLRLASRPDIVEELYEEQMRVLGLDDESLGDRNSYDSFDGKGERRGLRFEDLEKMTLLNNVVKETLRLHSSIHTVMRKVKNDLPIPGTGLVVSREKVLVASPIMSHLSPEHFEEPEAWDPHRWDVVGGGEKGGEGEGEDDLVDYGYGVTSKGTRSPYLPFGAGRHRCIGEKFAYVNLLTIVGTLVPRTDYSSLFSRPMAGARVGWERREEGSW
ncbi:cytochrome P450 sterol 14 alpha-demethylase [Rhexocercosporidium sp. MPI-PUGE-AT-0058]|nr:cytochrome P450 sterol 14 alpha-demethylase [Rhexocercosporidium sp. MPI-PUGE-AT-0058]